MNDHRKNGGGGVLILAAMVLPAGGASAQAVPVPQEAPRTIPDLVIATPTPAPARTPVPIPTGPVLGLPTFGARPRSTGMAGHVRSRTSRSERTVDAAPRTPSVAPTPVDRPTPEAMPTITAIPVPAPRATPPVAPTMVPVGEGRTGWPWLAIVAGVVALLALSGWALFRRRAAVVPAADVVEPAPIAARPLRPSPPPPAPAPVPVPIGPRARIGIALRPLRAGLNMLSAVVEAEVVVTNIGDAPAAQVRINATLLSAHAGQEADLAATFAAPPAGRPAAPPFALAAGEERRVRVVAALSREAVRSMDAGGRPMFVPLVAIDVRYAADADGVAGRTGQAFVIGVERVDSAKLAPFWLDGPLRMYDHIAARAQGAVVVD